MSSNPKWDRVKRCGMKRSGRASLVVVVAVALVAAVVVLFMMAGESPSGVASKFLTSLAKGDLKTVSELSYMEGLSQEQIRQKWDETYSVTKHWLFAFAIADSSEQDERNATVRLKWVKSAMNPSAYEEKYELPLIKVDGKWKVDVRGMSREMYPSLPR